MLPLKWTPGASTVWPDPEAIVRILSDAQDKYRLIIYAPALRAWEDGMEKIQQRTQLGQVVHSQAATDVNVS